jgi:hypothetical protein
MVVIHTVLKHNTSTTSRGMDININGSTVQRYSLLLFGLEHSYVIVIVMIFKLMQNSITNTKLIIDQQTTLTQKDPPTKITC